jgi:hypothetical protein
MPALLKQGPGGRPVRTRVNFLPPGTSLVGKPTYIAPQERIEGITMDGLWSPGQPTHPIAPFGTSPRGFQFLNYQNMIFTPRASDDYTFEDLRWLSRYPVARALIEARKDQIKTLAWQIRVKAKEGETNAQRLDREKGDTTIGKISGFLERPSSDCDWGDFSSMWTDEVLVHDAPAILIRRTRAGDIGELRNIDGAMVVRYVDQNGWTPQDGKSPAYAQLWWGMPGWNLTTDQLFYRPRNPRVHKLYGFSKTEMAAEYIELGWKRLEMQKRHYTDSTIPDAIQVVPAGVSPKVVAQQQESLRSQLAGNLARLSGLMLMQGFTKEGTDKFLFPKNELVIDSTVDDIIMRILCFIYGVSQQRLQKQMNRASAESSQEASEEEGLEPDKKYIKDKVNYLIQYKFGYPDYEFVFQETRERDIAKQAAADQIYVTCGVNTVNEIRKNKGDDPSNDPAANLLLIKVGTGTVPLGEVAQPAPTGGEGDENEPTPAGSKQPKGKKPGAKQPKGKQPKTGDEAHPVENKVLACDDHEEFQKDCAPCVRLNREAGEMAVNRIEQGLQRILAETMEKSRTAFQMVIDPHHVTPQGEQARAQLQDKVHACFGKCCKAVVARVKRCMGKADEKDEIVKQIMGDDDFWTSLWADLPADLEPSLEAATLAGMTKSVIEAQVHITEVGLIKEFNAVATEWATQHSAAMIGMRYDTKGNLIPNPNAKYSISDVTREQVRKIIVDAFSKDTPIKDVTAAIEQAGAFSADRAANIARTEVQMAQTNGNATVWEKLGLVQTAKWQTSNLPGVCEDCADNAAAGEVPFGQPYPSGDRFPPAHPGGCRCVLVSVKLGRSQQQRAA